MLLLAKTILLIAAYPIVWVVWSVAFVASVCRDAAMSGWNEWRDDR